MQTKMLLASLVFVASAGLALAQPNEQADADAAEAAAAPTPAVGFYTAAVTGGGKLVRGQNVLRSRRIGTGAYEVIFNADVTECVRVATLGNPGDGNPPAGELSTANRKNKSRGVFVQTGDSFGVEADRPFHLILSCD